MQIFAHVPSRPSGCETSQAPEGVAADICNGNASFSEARPMHHLNAARYIALTLEHHCFRKRVQLTPRPISNNSPQKTAAPSPSTILLHHSKQMDRGRFRDGSDERFSLTSGSPLVAEAHSRSNDIETESHGSWLVMIHAVRRKAATLLSWGEPSDKSPSSPIGMSRDMHILFRFI